MLPLAGPGLPGGTGHLGSQVGRMVEGAISAYFSFKVPGPKLGRVRTRLSKQPTLRLALSGMPGPLGARSSKLPPCA